MKPKMSWFDWLVRGAFWLLGIGLAIGIIAIAVREYWGWGDPPPLPFLG